MRAQSVQNGGDNDRLAFVSIERRGKHDLKETKVKESLDMVE